MNPRAGRFRASSEMIKHYDRFIGGHDSTVNHRREQREVTHEGRSLNDPCRSGGGRTLKRLRWKLFVFPSAETSCLPGDDDDDDTCDIRAHIHLPDLLVRTRVLTPSAISEPTDNCRADRGEASATGNEAIPDVTALVAA